MYVGVYLYKYYKPKAIRRDVWKMSEFKIKTPIKKLYENMTWKLNKNTN